MNNEKIRILQMSQSREYCKCPNCGNIIKPHFTGNRLYWCSICCKGKAGMFWISYGTAEKLAEERLKQLND